VLETKGYKQEDERHLQCKNVGLLSFFLFVFDIEPL